MQIEKILKRIKLNKKSLKNNYETLKLLQEAYVLNVPYENLDLVYKGKLDINLEAIYKKIVLKNRGGICYESNTLFAYLLKNLGFDVKLIFAKVKDLTYIGADYPHLTILLRLNKKEYLVDVAYGQSIKIPLNINKNRCFTSEGKIYKINKNKDEYTLLVKSKNKAFIESFCFNKKEVFINEYEKVFENSSFDGTKEVNRYILVTQALKNGRITLYSDTLKVKKANENYFLTVNESNIKEVLKKYFKIELN